VVLVAAEAENAIAEASSENRDVMAHDHQVPGSGGDVAAEAEAERIDHKTRSVGQMRRGRPRSIEIGARRQAGAQQRARKSDDF
jgi:hypothetical protein